MFFNNFINYIFIIFVGVYILLFLKVEEQDKKYDNINSIKLNILFKWKFCKIVIYIFFKRIFNRIFIKKKLNKNIKFFNIIFYDWNQIFSYIIYL